jgi:hypothetical protein
MELKKENQGLSGNHASWLSVIIIIQFIIIQ